MGIRPYRLMFVRLDAAFEIEKSAFLGSIPPLAASVSEAQRNMLGTALRTPKRTPKELT